MSRPRDFKKSAECEYAAPAGKADAHHGHLNGVAWYLDWLERLESAKGMRRRQLLPVSAEVCLAHARLGMATALNRWLTWFTDPSDPAALDPVQAALGGWQLRRG